MLVTGATVNTGLAIAKAFGELGDRVLLHGRQLAESTGAALSLAQNAPISGPGWFPIAADLADPAQVASMMASVKHSWGGIDVLVLNAAHQGLGGPFLDTDLSTAEATLRTNILAGFQCAQLAGRMMREQKSGSIIFLSSNCGERPIRNRAAYVASKGGIDALAKALAVELGPLGIRVNVVAPGYIWSDRWPQLDPETASRRRANVPTGHEAMPEEVARAVVFMADSRGSSINGARLVVDGGSSSQLYPADRDQ